MESKVDKIGLTISSAIAEYDKVVMDNFKLTTEGVNKVLMKV
jgi:hypothetical protein